MKRRGFTLIELLVSLAIFSVVGTAMISLLNQATNLYQGANACSAVERASYVVF